MRLVCDNVLMNCDEKSVMIQKGTNYAETLFFF